MEASFIHYGIFTSTFAQEACSLKCNAVMFLLFKFVVSLGMYLGMYYLFIACSYLKCIRSFRSLRCMVNHIWLSSVLIEITEDTLNHI